ncbi:hypothetical protein FRB99_006500, partial [Tulasnella sp. 403]
MANSHIIGTLNAQHTIDQNGSFNIDVPILLPPCNLDPGISFSYHSAAQDVGDMGPGWVIKGMAVIERVGATLVQDGFLGSVNYDEDDRFQLNGQRLVKVSGNEYRYEIEQWSKVVASGSDASNPDYWTEYLPDGSYRIFGGTTDSNIKAQGSSTATRVWAVSKYGDVFKNYVSYTYDNEADNGSFYISKIDYGDNEALSMKHQRSVSFTYEERPDVSTRFLGGHKIYSDKRLASISTSVNGMHAHTQSITYGVAPLTGKSRVASITIADASGASVSPITFDWNDASPSVYNPIRDLSSLTPGVSGPQMLPMDVNGNGKTDIVVASTQLVDDNNVLYLDVYLADDNGSLVHSTACSGSTGLDTHTQLLAISANDYGRTDMVGPVHLFFPFLELIPYTVQLHIEKVDDDGSGNQAHVMTVLLSTDSGFQPQSSFSFKPETFEGQYFTGDFKGDGRVGLIYVYNSMEGEDIVLRLVQLSPNGTTFQAASPVDIPGGMNLDQVQVVVGDFNGDGADDAFFIWAESGDTVAHIHLVQSKKGGLQYVGEALDSASAPIDWYDNIGFVTHDVGDGLVGLIAITSDLKGEIQLQTIRSTGKTLLALSGPQPTGLTYNGRVSVARTTSTDTGDLVIMSLDDSIRTCQVDVLRYNNDKFSILSGVQQPTPSQYEYTLNSVDIRGTGRADCLFSLVDYNGNISLSTLDCAGSPTPDVLAAYTNGLGGKTSVTFAPLTDPSIYTATDSSGTSPTAYTNALARNVTSAVPLASGLASTSVPARRRTMLVHCPKYVVKEITTCAAPSRTPDVKSTISYKYTNARFSPDGYGWLGFETVTQQNQPEGTNITSTYMQNFPYLGQPSSVVHTDTAGNMLKSSTYKWSSFPATSKSQSVTMSSQVENHYEGGSHTFDITVAYQYDSYANVTSQVTSVSDSGRPDCKITTEYSNDVDLWLLGRQTLQVVDPGDGAMTKTKFEYLPGTPSPSSVSKWVQGDQWGTQSFTYNEVGKEICVSGPGPAKATFTYDETYSFRTSETFQTGPSTSYTNTSSYDYLTGQVSSITDANGHITTFSYDVLSRPLNISEGDAPSSMVVMQKYSYLSDSDGAYNVHQTRTSWDGEQWGWEAVYTDGSNQQWRRKTNSPEDPNGVLCQDFVFDGAGRVIKQSRTYRVGDTPVFATCTFDSQSRPIKKTSPSLDPDAQPITIMYDHSYKSGRGQITECHYAGDNPSPTQVTVKQLQYYPDPDPSAHHLVQPLVVKMVDALSRNIDMTFDGLARPTSATDPTGCELAVAWDGISRQVERHIFKAGGKTISHFTMAFDDENCQLTLKNELTSSTAVTTYDYTQRPIKRTTADETIDLTYDTGTSNSKSRLASVSSSSGVERKYDYDTRGNLANLTIGIDGRAFKTSYEWTPAKRVSRTTNPDGTSVAHDFFDQTSFVKNMSILDSGGKALASTAFSKFNTATFRPTVCSLGNGLVSTVTTADNGAPTSSVLKNGSTTLHSQAWALDSFSKIQSYNLAHSDTELSMQFTYDAGGQLLKSNSSKASDTYTYDDSGNLSSQNSDIWVSDGWQLTSITDPNGNATATFQYSADGNLTAKLDASQTVTTSMTYDSDGRLTSVNKTSFVYDYQGRLLRATRADGSVTYYPNPEYDMTVKTSGDETHMAHIISGWRRAFTSIDKVGGTPQAPKSYYLQADHLGSIVAVLDDSGSIVTTYDYDSYGHTTIHGDDISRYKFSGKEVFEGLLYFGARFYDPEIRRFITLDNITVSLENITPQSFNQYTYSRNDPVNYVDVNGNVPWWHWVVAVGLIVLGCVIIAATDGAATPLVYWAGSIIGSAILGTGTSALQTDIMAEVYNKGQVDEKEWLKSMALGAAFGAGSGAVGGAFARFAAPKLGGWVLQRVGSLTGRVSKYFQPFSKWGGTTLAQLGLKTGQTTGLAAAIAFGKSFLVHEALSITIGVGGQLVKNLAAGREWDYHLTGVLWVSAVTGFGNAATSGLTSGILKNVGSEVATAEMGIFDAMGWTAVMALNDTKRV